MSETICDICEKPFDSKRVCVWRDRGGGLAVAFVCIPCLETQELKDEFKEIGAVSSPAP